MSTFKPTVAHDYIDLTFHNQYLIVEKYHGSRTCSKYTGSLVFEISGISNHISTLIELKHYPIKDENLVTYLTLQGFVEDNIIRTLLHYNISIVNLSSLNPMEVYE